jgi:hypothetical protein
MGAHFLVIPDVIRDLTSLRSAEEGREIPAFAGMTKRGGT